MGKRGDKNMTTVGIKEFQSNMYSFLDPSKLPLLITKRGRPIIKISQFFQNIKDDTNDQTDSQ